MVNKQDILTIDENPLGHWEESNKKLPEMFYQRHLPDPSKIYPEQPYNKLSANKKDNQDYDIRRNQYEMATTDDSDELEAEAATSDSSEPEHY